MKNQINLLKQNWIFYASRNIAVWHNSLTINYFSRGLKKYKLPTFLIMSRIHRGFESDFYHIKDGQGKSSVIIEALKNKLKNKKYLSFLKKQYQIDGKKLLKLSKHLTNNKVSLQKFFEFYGTCTPLLDITFMSSAILTNKIIDELHNNPKLQEILAYYSTPKQLAPIQQLEREVSKYTKNINLEKFAEKLFKKYNWIPVSFVGEPWSREYFINLLKEKKLEHKIPTKPKTKLNKEILDMMKTGKDMHRIVEERKQNPIIIYTANTNEFGIKGPTAVKQHEEKFKFVSKNIKEIKGTTANKGIYEGTVRVILRHQYFDKFKTGEILVATMTSVDYIPLMKKAGALVTDEGGLACHAAVVSREFNLPCIIGTKIATKVLRDGDKVEVDANSGIIKIL